MRFLFDLAIAILIATTIGFATAWYAVDRGLVFGTVTVGRSSFEIAHKLSLKEELCAECSEKRVWTVRDASGQLKSHPIPGAVLAKFK